MNPCRPAFAALVAMLAIAPARAHELGAGRVDVAFPGDGTYRVEAVVDPETTLHRLQLAAGEALSEGLAADELEAALAAREAALRGGFELRVGGVAATPSCNVLLRDPAGDGSALEAVVRLAGDLPPGTETMQVTATLPRSRFALTVRHSGSEEVDTYWVEPGELSPPLPVAPPPVSRLAVAGRYLGLGFTHILPKGLDHILFVLGLFLLAARLGPLLAQVTAFTVAHTITLGLAIYGVVALPPAIVEPLIALSIVYVAVENVYHPRLTRWRIAVVFAFGLLHGLGFAGVLHELGLPRGQFLTALVGFNVGVELGQLAVVLTAFLAVASWSRHAAWYRRRLVVPASLAIAAVGLWWTFERILG